MRDLTRRQKVVLDVIVQNYPFKVFQAESFSHFINSMKGEPRKTQVVIKETKIKIG